MDQCTLTHHSVINLLSELNKKTYRMTDSWVGHTFVNQNLVLENELKKECKKMNNTVSFEYYLGW